MALENIEVGTLALAKVGRNAIEVEVIAIEDGICLVRNRAGKEFRTRRVERIPAPAHVEMPVAALHDVPETAAARPGEKHISLLEAAVQALRMQAAGTALNSRELIELVTQLGLWTPTACKTPEQTLYGAIFREIATKENPRIRKSEKRGLFEYAL